MDTDKHGFDPPSAFRLQTSRFQPLAFQRAGVKTVVLFFEKGAPTRKTWFYQFDPGRNLGKSNPLNSLSPRPRLQRRIVTVFAKRSHLSLARTRSGPPGFAERGILLITR